MFRRNNRIWRKGLVCKSSIVAYITTRWYNKRILIKGYSVPGDFSWIENYKLICHAKRQNHVFGPNPAYAPVVRTKYFFCCKTSNTGTIGNRATANILPTLFDQIRKYYAQNNKIPHLVSHIALHPPTLLIGMREPSNSVPGSSDRHFNRGQFRNNFKLRVDKI